MRQETFQDRIKALYESSLCTSLTEFGNEVGLSRQAIKAYMTGKRKLPDGQSIMKICSRFSVSADWLLGLTETRNLSPNVKTAVAALGISETAVERIVNPEFYANYKETLSHLLENQDFKGLLQYYQSFLKSLNRHYTYTDYTEGFYTDEEGYVILNPGMATDFFMNRTVDFFRGLLNQEIWKNMETDNQTPDNEENF